MDNPETGFPVKAFITRKKKEQFCLTEKVVEALQTMESETKIHIIATNLVSDGRINSLKQQGCLIHIDISANKVAYLFDTCEAAILSTSSVAIEALSRGIPVYAGYYVDNQNKFCNYLTDKGYINSLGCLLDEGMAERLLVLIQAGIKGNNRIPQNLFATKDKYIKLFQSI